MPRPTWPVALIALSILVILIGAEWLWSKRAHRTVFDRKESRENLIIYLGMRLSSLLLSGWVLFWLRSLREFSHRSVISGPLALLVGFLAVDFVYYWEHRILHHSPALWAFHGVHHQSRNFNFTAALRLPWFAPVLTPLFYAPLALLGFSEVQILGSLAVNLLYQFFLHTQAIPRLPLLEGILNTPASHRVHHGRNLVYRDRNFGGFLMLWDRLFGTYQAEIASEPIAYGSDHIPQGPIDAVFGEFRHIRWNLPFWRANLILVFRNGCGWIALCILVGLTFLFGLL